MRILSSIWTTSTTLLFYSPSTHTYTNSLKIKRKISTIFQNQATDNAIFFEEFYFILHCIEVTALKNPCKKKEKLNILAMR